MLDPTTLRVFLRACRFRIRVALEPREAETRARRGISSARKADGGTSRMGMSPVRGTSQIGVLTLTHGFEKVSCCASDLGFTLELSTQDRFVRTFTNTLSCSLPSLTSVLRLRSVVLRFNAGTQP